MDFLHVGINAVGEVGDVLQNEPNKPLVLILQSGVLLQDVLHASGGRPETPFGVFYPHIRGFLSQKILIQVSFKHLYNLS